MPRPPMDPEKRQAIVDSLRAGEGWRARNDIAREHSVAASTVGKIADEEGIVFDRTSTARASAAKRVDNQARRAELSRLLLEDSFKLRERMWAPGETVVPSGQVVVTELPVARDVRDFSASVQSNVKAHLEIEKHDTGDQGAADAKSMLLGVAEGLRSLAVSRLTGAEDGDPED